MIRKLRLYIDIESKKIKKVGRRLKKILNHISDIRQYNHKEQYSPRFQSWERNAYSNLYLPRFQPWTMFKKQKSPLLLSKQ